MDQDTYNLNTHNAVKEGLTSLYEQFVADQNQAYNAIIKLREACLAVMTGDEEQELFKNPSTLAKAFENTIFSLGVHVMRLISDEDEKSLEKALKNIEKIICIPNDNLLFPENETLDQTLKRTYQEFTQGITNLGNKIPDNVQSAVDEQLKILEHSMPKVIGHIVKMQGFLPPKNAAQGTGSEQEKLTSQPNTGLSAEI